jgi:outer membrane protein
MRLIYNFLFLSIILILTPNLSHAEQLKIFYVDIDKIVKESNVGKKVEKDFLSIVKKKNKEFDKIEKDLKKKDSDLIKQKNILSKDELSKKIKSLEKEIKSYRTDKSKFNQNISQKKLRATSEMVVYLNRILGKYASDNSASLIIQKKNIIIGKSELDITQQILEIFNKEVKSVKFN